MSRRAEKFWVAVLAEPLKCVVVGVCHSPEMSVLLRMRDVGLVPEGQRGEHGSVSKRADQDLVFLYGLCP